MTTTTTTQQKDRLDQTQNIEVTQMTIDSLVESIESLANEDYHVQCGWYTDIYLNPEAKTVYTFVSNNSQPRAAYHNIDQRITRVSPNAIADSVRDQLMGVIELLEEIIEAYQGSIWNGSNHVGIWNYGAEYEVDRIYQSIIESISIAYYWEASDWFQDDASLKAAWEAGKTPEEAIEDEHLGDVWDGGICKEADAIAYAQHRWEEWHQEVRVG